MFTNISDAPEVLQEYTPKAADRAVIAGVSSIRYRFSKTIDYTGLTEDAAVTAADNLESDIEGEIKVDGVETSPTLHVDGFTNATGIIFPGVAVLIDGDDHLYHVQDLATIATSEVDLELTENYLEAGTILVNGGGQTGTALAIDGFTNVSGFVRQGTIVAISGDATVYTVTDEVAIVNNGATVAITPTLAAAPSDDTAVTLTHAVNDSVITLEQAGVAGSAVRTQGPMFSLRVQIDYYDGPYVAEV